MDPNEHKELLESVFPIGKERWIKVKYTDFDWCVQNLRTQYKEGHGTVKLGFEVTAIGVRDEYLPQIQALFDVKSQVVGTLQGRVPDYVLELISDFFKTKMDELKERTIQDVADIGDKA